MNIMQVDEYYTGYEDQERSYQTIPVAYPKTLQGSVMQTIRTPKEKDPLIVFQTANTDGTIKETYFVQGQYYFTLTSKVFRPISELGSIFGGIQVNSITLGGYLFCEVDKKMVYIAIVNEDLYTTDTNYTYQNIGKPDSLLDGLNFIYSEFGISGRGIDKDGNGVLLPYTIDSPQHNLYILTSGPYPNFEEDAFLKTTGMYRAVDSSSRLISTTHINRNYTYLTEHFLEGSTTGIFQIENPIYTIGTGTTIYYQVSQTSNFAYKLLTDKVIETKDNCQEVTSFTYNNKFQMKTSSYTRQVLNQAEKTFSIQQVIEKQTEYLWESQQLAAKEAEKNATGIISQTSEKITQSGISFYLDKTRMTYQIRDSGYISGTARIYCAKTEKIDGLDGEKWMQEHNVKAMNTFGVPYLVEGKYVSHMPKPRVDKHLYMENACLNIADFYNMRVNSETNSQSAHYLGFEPYENMSISGNSLQNEYFSAENVELVDVSFLGSRSLRFKQNNTYLKTTKKFYAISGINYIFSCWRRNSSSDSWRFFIKKVTGEQLNQSHNIHNFNSGNEISNVMLREENTVARIYIYDPQTFRLKATIDNNGVPIMYVYDRLERLQFSYIPELIKDSSTNEAYFKLTGDIAINPFTLNGYARFKGFNCEKSITENSSLYNTVLTAIFPEKGQTISMDGGSHEGLDTKTLFAAGAWLTSAQKITIVRKPNETIVLLFQGNTAVLRINDKIVASSESYVADHSAWSLFILDKILVVFVNGKLILSYILEASATINSIATEVITGSRLHNILVAKKVDLQMSYYDYSGNLIQSQKLRDNRMLLAQNLYDRHDNLVMSTAPAFFPSSNRSITTDDHPLSYRSTFAQIDFSDSTSRGVLSGELADFYQSTEGGQYCEHTDDYKWPYICYSYESNAENRLISTYSPGQFGIQMQELNQYHDSNTYKNYMSQYKNIRNIDYSSNVKYYSDRTSEKLMISQMYDLSGNRYGMQLLGQLEKAPEVKYGIEVEHGIFLSPTTNNPSVTERFFLAGRPGYITEHSTSHANRYSYKNSLDYNMREILYDSLGNARLTISRSLKDSCFKYAKYDLLGRVLELGTVILTGELKDYEVKVNNPSFPTASDGTIQVYYRYNYNLNNGNPVDFGMGKITSEYNALLNLTTSYTYDFLGNRIQINNTAPNINNVAKYEYNISGNPTKIIYPANIGYQSEYTYDGNGNIEKIILKKSDDSKTHTLLSDPKHDVFDQICTYTNAQGKTVQCRNTIYQHLVELGETANGPKVKKVYCKHIDPDIPGSIDIDNGNNKIVSEFVYDELQRLISCQQTGATPSDSTYTYDYMDNLTFNRIGEELYTFTYDENKLKFIKNSSRITVADFTYYEDGLLSKYVKNQESYTLTRDAFFASKYQSITKDSSSTTLNFLYNALGNKLVEKSGTSLLFYGYSGEGQLDYTTKSGSYGQNTLYIYCGSKLIAEFHLDSEELISLMYDNMLTLRYLSTTQSGTVKAKALNYTTPWGKFTGYGTEIPKVTFLYGGLSYLELLDCYEDDGELFLPEYGISGSPSLNQTFKTPYRPFGAQPIL